jgi:hypothetical protein
MRRRNARWYFVDKPFMIQRVHHGKYPRFSQNPSWTAGVSASDG